MKRVLQYLVNLVHLLDQVLNTILGGDPRMTLSARMGRDLSLGKCKFCGFVCKILNLFQPNHCDRAWQSELKAPDPTHQVVDE
jgi:hypothetical protein